MNHVERFKSLMRFEPVDRLPCIEWAGYWDKTVTRWQGEGLPAGLGEDRPAIQEWFGLDPYHQTWISSRGSRDLGRGIQCLEDYQAVLEDLYPDRTFADKGFQATRKAHDRGDLVLWITFDGFFWFPRILFGIEAHLYAFYDAPDLMHRINQDLVQHQLKMLDRYCEQVGVPEFMTLAEDMSCNHGPMLSKDIFDEFLAPYYRQIVPALKARGIRVLIDSDGDVSTMIPWLKEVGIEGLLPWEKQSGVDVAQIRKNHPDFLMIGAFDKMCMPKGEGPMREEFDRLLPLMQQGGCIPSVDHQTPPSVDMATYKVFVRLLKEYARLGAKRGGAGP